MTENLKQSLQQKLDILKLQYPRALRQDPTETHGERFRQRMAQEPFIPIGCLATVGVFCGMVLYSKKGDSRKVQLWMRARIVTQGLTVCAVALGMYRVQQDTNAYNQELASIRETWDAQTQQSEKSAFEGRLKEAEAAYEEESGLFKRAKSRKDEPTPTPTASTSKRWYHSLWPTSSSSSERITTDKS